MSISRITGYVLILLAIVVVIGVAFKNSETSKIPVIFSARDMVNATWSQYKDKYFEKGTSRVLDTSRGNVTTSEAESYAMLRSVWLDDHVTFDASWQWTKDNLQHKNDALFAWLFGQRSNGSYGVLTSQNGNTAASDADTDIAVALLFANKRWQDPKYQDQALPIIQDIWKKEVVLINGRPYLASDDTDHSTSNFIVMNPSYFAPYAYRVFAQVDKDPKHDWMALVDTSYEVIDKTLTSSLDVKKSAFIPPDWIVLNRSTLAVTATGDARYTTNYSYDALRVPWRLWLDYTWYGDARAQKILKNMDFLRQEWVTNGRIHSEYKHDGTVANQGESPAMYAGSLPVLMATDPAAAKKLYEQKLLTLFSPDNETWVQPLGYYNENWVWFGIALYNNFLPNLWQETSQ